MKHLHLRLCLSLMLPLAACGGGGGDTSSSSGDSQALSLGSDSDAARELAMVMQLAAQRLGELPGHGSSASSSTAGSVGGAKAAQQSSCSGGGTVSSQAAPGTHDFSYFGAQTLSVSGEQKQYAQCVQPLGSASSESETLNGSIESASTAAAGDGSRLYYQLLGSGSSSYSSMVSVSSGGSSASFSASYLGEVETQLQSNGDEDIRAVLQTRVSDSQNDSRVYTFGPNGAPFIVALNNGVALSLSGSYQYQTPGCSGGRASVATPSALQFDSSSGVPVAGELELNSGSHQLHLVFQTDGSAVVQLDGATLAPLSATQVHSALWRNPC
ncbi:hypothetical protein SAMN04488038_103185 [Solimonas aquatica]|uniref:Lipoprotein n=1 Tax=Solimonas aquatica TaxID=489703 RepID=A0A1H9CW39_9GAMM|nr:hypothetical protein [Solimonas aquatica]SEQ04803.1 hypothetical protein SAMN04488038_103185 [Solimonas aquatica]